MGETQESTAECDSHVLIFPYPAQGHVNSMLNLAELLSLSGKVAVTFLNSDYNQRRLLNHSSMKARFSGYPSFRFETYLDGLTEEHPRSGHRVMDLIASVNERGAKRLRELVLKRQGSGCPPVSCVVADGVMSFAIDVAKEVGVRLIFFRTISACAFWVYFCIPRLIHSAEFPFRDDDMDEQIKSIPCMEGLMRRRDLPGFLRSNDPSDPNMELVIQGTQRSLEGQAMILNTFEDLEAPVLAQIREYFPVLYIVGPLHAHLRSKLTNDIKASLSTSLWEEDRCCIPWLDSHSSDSVIYVSFGSITIMTKNQMTEFWHGLVNSEKPFLWVIRLDEEGDIRSGMMGKGCVVRWAPQEEVLNHRAVGGFMTHSGWNSTLESLAAGKAMVCWPYFADQQVNSRFVSEAWGVGVDMKDVCDRVTVERYVREVMEEGPRREALVGAATTMKNQIKQCVVEGGSSCRDMDRLIHYIRENPNA